MNKRASERTIVNGMGWVFIAARDFLVSLAYCTLLMRDSHFIRLNYAVNMLFGTPVFGCCCCRFALSHSSCHFLFVLKCPFAFILKWKFVTKIYIAAVVYGFSGAAISMDEIIVRKGEKKVTQDSQPISHCESEEKEDEEEEAPKQYGMLMGAFV